MRRRAAQHVRHLPDKAVLVNDGVTYSDDAKVSASPKLRDALTGLVVTPPNQFPDPMYRQQARWSPWKRLRRRFIAQHRKQVIFNGLNNADYESWHKVSVNPETGTGTLLWRNKPNTFYKRILVGPGAELSHGLTCGADLPLVDLSGGFIHCARLDSVNFQGAVLDEVDMKFFDMGGVNFKGASLRNVRFPYCSVTSTVSMAGADLTGASFSQVSINRPTLYADSTLQPDDVYIDFADSNVTVEQIEQLELRNPYGPLPIRYRQYSFDEVGSLLLGADKEELGVRIWAGDIEARDNTTRRVVDTFDADQCHIPQWEVQKLLGAGG